MGRAGQEDSLVLGQRAPWVWKGAFSAPRSSLKFSLTPQGAQGKVRRLERNPLGILSSSHCLCPQLNTDCEKGQETRGPQPVLQREALFGVMSFAPAFGPIILAATEIHESSKEARKWSVKQID